MPNDVNYLEPNSPQLPVDQNEALIPIEQIQNQPKIKTDEDIPIKFKDDENFIGPQHNVHQKYDLVSKNQDEDDIENSLNNCNFQKMNDQEPEDSQMDMISLRSTQTQNVMMAMATNQTGALRRMNSQENILQQSQFLNAAGDSQGGYS